MRTVDVTVVTVLNSTLLMCAVEQTGSLSVAQLWRRGSGVRSLVAVFAVRAAGRCAPSRSLGAAATMKWRGVAPARSDLREAMVPTGPPPERRAALVGGEGDGGTRAERAQSGPFGQRGRDVLDVSG